MKTQIATKSNNRALLVIAHGSPRPDANKDFLRILEMCRLQGKFGIVQEAFLECNEPSIPVGIEMCVKNGATEITAVPYFLHSGRHVACDLPAEMFAAERLYPDVKMYMADFLGQSEVVTDILAARLISALA